MKRCATIAMAFTLAVASSSVCADDYQIYRPDKAPSPEIPAPGAGVLTRTIVIQKGDTLSKLSRRYSGRSSYFPQILLFNNIENPDLIYAGNTLRVPVTRREGTGGSVRHEGIKGKTARQAKRSTPYLKGTGGAARVLFNRGMTAFARGKYREAIAIFDNYLAAYPKSADAPEASLYRADSYLRLSGGR